MKKCLIALSLTLSSLIFANETLNDFDVQALSIKSVEVREVPNPFTDKGIVELPKAPTNPIDEISIMIDGLIAIGKKIWPIIDAGRPVINNKLAPAVSILPALQSERGVLTEMSGWSIPKAQSFRVSYKNYFGMEVVGFTYTIMFQYNGSLKGVGKYITSLKIMASNIYTAWGFDFDANSELIGISNVGTDENPVASGIIGVSYAVRGKLNEARNADSLYVDGYGRLQVLNQ
jgi:hypothetical protein